MKYYIDKNNEIHGFELDGSQDFLITEDMKPITIEEIKSLQQSKEDQYKATNEYKIQEAKDFLSSTDHKFYNGYKPKDGEDLVALELQRDEVREFIRANKI